MIAEIGGADRTAYLKVNSCRFNGDLNGRWSLSAQLEGGHDGYPGSRPVRGQPVEINDGLSPVTIYFAGNISRIVERHHPGTTALQFDVEARDYNHIPSRRLVTAEYENQTLYAIVSHINTTFLNGEGIALTGVTNPGPTITEKLTFRYESAASCFNRLSAITGYQWKIDFSKVLYFVEYTAASPVAFTVTDTSENWRDFEVEISDEDYRNRQHERTEIAVASTAGSFSSTNPTEDPETAVAGQTVFRTKAAVMEMRRITVDGVDKTFYEVPEGESIPGSGYDFYCLLGHLGFFAIDWGPAVGGEVLRCDYLAGWSLYSDGGGGTNAADPAAGVRVVTADDLAAQVARAAIEGGSGIWEAIEEQRNISSAAALQAIAEGRLRQYAIDASHVRFTTDDGADLLPGQRIVINLSTLHGINATYLIERIEQDWVAARSDFFRTRVTCTTAEPYGQASSFVEKLVETARIGPGGGGGSSVAPGGGAGGGPMVIQEAPAGTVDGSNAVFTLTYQPDPAASLRLSVSGLVMNPIAGEYSLSGATIAYATGCQPKTGETHLAWYFHGGLTPVTDILPSPSIGVYTNPLAAGYRKQYIAVTTDLSLALGSITDLIDGELADTMAFNDQAVSGKYIKFDFGAGNKFLIDEVTWYQKYAAAQGTWKWQGSHDGSFWVDIGSSFELTGTAQVQTDLSGNLSPFRCYRLLGVSGSTHSSEPGFYTSYIHEIKFSIGAVVTSGASYLRLYGTGPRTDTVTATTTISVHSAFTDIIDGKWSGTLYTYGDACSGKEFKFQFPAAVVITEATWNQLGSNALGVWKWQGSQNGTDWTDIGTSFTLGGSAAQVQMQLAGNTTAYLYYRLLGISGNTVDGTSLYEIEFKIQ